MQDLGVFAAGDHFLEGLQYRLGQAAVLRNRNAIGRGVVGLAGQLELAARLLNDPGRHRRVGHAHLCAAADDGEVGAVLVGEHRHRHGLLAGGHAFLALLGGVCGLGRAFFHGHGHAAQIGQPIDLGAALALDVERGARRHIADEVDDFFTLLGDGEGRHAHVVLARLQCRNDAVETGVDEIGLHAELLGDGLAQIDVGADDGLAVLGDEFHRRIGGVGSDGQVALFLVFLRQGDGGCRCAGAENRAQRHGTRQRAQTARRCELAKSERHDFFLKRCELRCFDVRQRWQAAQDALEAERIAPVLLRHFASGHAWY